MAQSTLQNFILSTSRNSSALMIVSVKAAEIQLCRRPPNRA
jgi:hypothetical protein